MANFKKVLAFALSAAMVLTAVPAANVNAAKKVALSAKKGTIKVKKTKKVTIKNTKKANITKVTFKYSKKNIAKATWKKATANKITIKGLKAGKTKITATIKLKNKVAGKKTYKLAYTATVKKASTTPTVVAMTGVALSNATPMVGDTLVATPVPADATDVASYTWYMGDNATLIATTIADATTSSLVLTEAMQGKYIKVMATDTEGNSYEAATTAPVSEKKVVLNITEVKQTKANEIAITFDQAAKDVVNKDLISVARVDGLGVNPVNALVWSEDGKTVTATLAQALEDKVDYQVSYNGGAATGFTASVGKVAKMAILTASAEQNVKTKIEFALYDENGVDVTSAVAVDNDLKIEIEGVDGAVVTSDTSKVSAASVTMTTVGDKAKVTLTYAPANAENTTVAPATGIVECTSPKATVGKARFKRSGGDVKTYTDQTSCAKFYTGTDATGVTVGVGQTINDLFFCAESEKDAGEIISYDSYEISSSNDDVMSAALEGSADTGKFTQINVSGNKVGTANIRVKAVKNSAETIYVIPVTVVAEVTLQSISATVSRSSMSNAIDYEYYGKIKTVAKYSDGSTKTLDPETVAFEIVDEEKKQGLSVNLLKAADLKANKGDGDSEVDDDEKEWAVDRGARSFIVDEDGWYYAQGSKANTYTVQAAVTNDAGKEVTARVSVAVKDLPVASWDLSGDGAKMEYSMEFTNGATIDEKDLDDAFTTAKLAAYTNKLFAGFVRNESGVIQIGSSTKAQEKVDEVPAEAVVTIGKNSFAISATKTLGGYVEGKTITVKTAEAYVAPTATYTNGAFTLYVPENKKVETDPATSAEYRVEVTHAATGSGYVAFAGANTPVHDTETADEVATALANEDSVDWKLTADNQFITATARKAGAITAPVATEDAGVTFGKVTCVRTGADAVVGDVTADMIAKALKEAVGAKGLDAGWVSVAESESAENLTFSSYTAHEDAIAAVGSANATDATEITNIRRAVKYGSTFSTDGNVFNWKKNGGKTKDAAVAGTSITVDPVSNADDLTILAGNNKYDEFFAKAGTYTVTFFYKMNNKDQTASSNVTVTNGLVAPTVTVTKRVLESLGDDDVRDALRINCDMNSNVSDADSWTGKTFKNNSKADNGIFDPSSADSDKWIVTYVEVVDRDLDIFWIVPVNATFTQKA